MVIFISCHYVFIIVARNILRLGLALIVITVLILVMTSPVMAAETSSDEEEFEELPHCSESPELVDILSGGTPDPLDAAAQTRVPSGTFVPLIWDTGQLEALEQWLAYGEGCYI